MAVFISETGVRDICGRPEEVNNLDIGQGIGGRIGGGASPEPSVGANEKHIAISFESFCIANNGHIDTSGAKGE